MNVAFQQNPPVKLNNRTFLIDYNYGNDTYPHAHGFATFQGAWDAAKKRLGITTDTSPVTFLVNHYGQPGTQNLLIDDFDFGTNIIIKGNTGAYPANSSYPTISTIRYYNGGSATSKTFYLTLIDVNVTTVAGGLAGSLGLSGTDVALNISGGNSKITLVDWRATNSSHVVRISGNIVVETIDVSGNQGATGQVGGAGTNSNGADGSDAVGSENGHTGVSGGTGGTGGDGGVGDDGGPAGTIYLDNGVIVTGSANAIGGTGGTGGIGGTGGSANGGNGGRGADAVDTLSDDGFGNYVCTSCTNGYNGGDAGWGGTGGTGGQGGQGGNGGTGGTVVVGMGCSVALIVITGGSPGAGGAQGVGGTAVPGQFGAGGFAGNCGCIAGSNGVPGNYGTTGSNGSDGGAGTSYGTGGSLSVHPSSYYST